MEQVWVALILITLVVVVVVLVARYERRREAEVERVWRAFAKEHGLEWHPTSGSWWNRRHASATGAVNGAAFTLERFYQPEGKHRVAWTRMRTTLARPLAERVIVGRRTWSTRLQSAFRGPIVETGVTRFDRAWLVRSRSRDAARELLGDEVRDALEALPKCARVEADGSRLSVWWRDVERDPRTLARGLAVVAAASGRSARGLRADQRAL